MDPITAALAAGAAAGLSEVAAQGVKDAHARLKGALTARFPRLAGQVQALESRPDSKAKQDSLSEELAETKAEQEAELHRLAQALIEAIEREAPQAAVRAGVDLKRVKGQFLNVQRVTGGVRVEDAEMSGGGINITDVGSREGLTQTAEGGRRRPDRGENPDPSQGDRHRRRQPQHQRGWGALDAAAGAAASTQRRGAAGAHPALRGP